MKNIAFIILFVLAFINPVSGQYLINQTSFTPVNFQTHTENVNFHVGNGVYFIGVKTVTTGNGKVISSGYTGYMQRPDGTKIYHGTGYGYDNNMRFNGNKMWEVTPSGEVYVLDISNGQQVGRSRYINQNYYINNNHTISFVQNSVPVTTYNNGGTVVNNNNSNSGGSSYNRHEATCRGCDGTGLCRHCHGSGYVNNYKSKCSLCHGTGRCVSCAGRGKIHGNF